MKFVDEASLSVIAGNGGSGCVSFRREKYVPRGGPDGGDGGNGGSVFLVGRAGLSTLADFRVTRKFKAGKGEAGAGRNRSGKSGDDLTVDVPCGTRVYEQDTGELIGDITGDQQQLLVAAGGHGGKGNARFKSSINRAPRRSTPGTPGEKRPLHLELTVLADTGLLGMPNAGKSTLIRAVSAARPKVADYPFTTLYPNLGVVAVEAYRSFVMADVPGLIGGAADGAGLGARFLKHLDRTRLLLHLVDIAPAPDTSDPVDDAKAILAELERFSPDLAQRERWLVLNKIDLLSDAEMAAAEQRLTEALTWSGPLYRISALTGDGTTRLTGDLMNRIEELDAAAAKGDENT